MPVSMTEDNKKKLGLSGATNLSAANPQSSRSRNSYVDQSSRSRKSNIIDQSSRSPKPNIIDQSSRSNQGPGGIPLPGGENFKAGGLPSISTFGDGANPQRLKSVNKKQRVVDSGFGYVDPQGRDTVQETSPATFDQSGRGSLRSADNFGAGRAILDKLAAENPYVDPQGRDTVRETQPENPQLNRGAEARTRPGRSNFYPSKRGII